MAGQIGDLIFQLMGKQDPRDALVAAVAGDTSGTPQAAGDTQGGGGTTHAMVAPGGAQQPPPDQTPEAYKSPPQLVQLYSDLMKRQDINNSLDRGIGLIGASLAQDQNKDSILNAFNGGSASGAAGSDPGSMVNNLLALRANQTAMATKAAQRATLPAIAEKYGLDLATATYLFDTGKLDAVIAEAEKPNKSIVQDENGQHYIVDATDGTVGTPFGTAKKREIELVEDPVTKSKIAVYKDTKERVGADRDIKGNRPTEWVEDPTSGTKTLVYADDKSPVPESNRLQGSGNTTDQKDYAAAMRGLPAEKQVTFDDWLREQANLKAPKTTINNVEGTALEKEAAKTASVRMDTEYDAARGARDTIDYVKNARAQLDKGIVAGSILSPAELQGRKLWAKVIGMPDEATTNTETFQASLKETVLSKIKALGSGTAISDADRSFIESAVGGDITLNEASMRRIFDILDKGARTKITNYNKEVDDLLGSYTSEDDKRKIGRLIRRVDVPEDVPAADDGNVDDLIKKYGSK